jgi:DNA mismatch repair protein MutL
MPSIRILPAHLVNKIAAGEVIERPSSVVKELVENALDAGATRIDVAVQDGGRKLIAVTDNGTGMTAEDLSLAFAPHATSKIATEDDLYRISTMGFRGEALASVASISHAHIRSARRPDAGERQTPSAPAPAAADAGGHEVEASGEAIGQVKPCAAACGTTITVRDLFYNTPARRKFLRTVNTELGHITDQIARVALPCPHVAFTLTHNGREVLNLPAAPSVLQRTGDLFGQEIIEGLLPVRTRAGPVRVGGLVSVPAAGRASGKWQYFFLNGRYIRDRLLSHALKEAYRGLTDPNRWPVAMLFLQIDPAEVDVNVHPTKIEVRFRDSQAVHGELLAALRDTLNRANLTPRASLDQADAGAPDPLAEEALSDQAPKGAGDEQRRQSLREALADFFKSAPKPQPRLDFSQPAPGSSRTGEPAAPQGGAYQATDPDRVGAGADFLMTPLLNAEAPPEGGPAEGVATPPERGVELPEAPSKGSALPGEPASAPGALATFLPAAIQIHNAYIVTGCQDGLLVVDQHALHERLVYNDLKRRIAEGTLSGQRLLIPEPFQVTPAEDDALQRHADSLARMGIEVAPFGPATVALQQFPTLLAERGIQGREFLREILDCLSEEESTDPERLLESLLETLACKAAVKAGDPLKPEEIASLLARREEAEKGSACPHGRPTTLRLTLKDLDKQFKRS